MTDNDVTPIEDEDKKGIDVEEDVESDPALDDESGGEWADEGGAVPDGPATQTADS